MIYSQMSDGWSWMSSNDWMLSEAKLQGFAKAVVVGDLNGIVFDAEAYGLSPWIYDTDIYDGYTLDQVKEMVR